MSDITHCIDNSRSWMQCDYLMSSSRSVNTNYTTVKCWYFNLETSNLPVALRSLLRSLCPFTHPNNSVLIPSIQLGKLFTGLGISLSITPFLHLSLNSYFPHPALEFLWHQRTSKHTKHLQELPQSTVLETDLTKLSRDTAAIECLQCFDTVGWAAGRASGL